MVLDVNPTTDHGKIPLIIACVLGHVTIVKYLIEYGAEVNAIYNGCGKTYNISGNVKRG